MSSQRKRKRCDGKTACYMPLPRACIDSLPQHCIPHFPIFRPYSAHNALSCSSQSDCSCEEENFCTVETCRNAAMCISTQPQYCPYGIKDLTDGKEYRSPRTSQEKNRNMHIINHPPHSEYARDLTSRLAHPQTTLSPSVPYSTESCFPPTAGYPPVPGVSFYSRTPSGLQRLTPAPRLNQNSPQHTNVLPKPQIVINHTPDRSPTQEQEAAISEQRMFAQSTHLPFPESAIGRRRFNPPSHQHHSFYGPLQDTAPSLGYENRRRNLPSNFQETQHRSMQYMNHSAGHSGGTCGTGLPVHRTIPDTSNDSNYRSELTSVPVPPDRMIGVTKSKALETSKVFHDPSPMGSPQTNDVKYHTPVASTISHAQGRVNTFLSTNENELRNVSKCSCCFPPAFKNFTCTGNISGACNCDDDYAE